MAKIDKDKCIGCGVCAGICPEGFEIIDGKSHIKDQNASCLKQAASSCPREAIVLDEDGAARMNDVSLPDNQNEDAQEEQKNAPFRGRGLGRKMGRGFGRGRGRGGGRRMGRGLRRHNFN